MLSSVVSDTRGQVGTVALGNTIAVSTVDSELVLNAVALITVMSPGGSSRKTVAQTHGVVDPHPQMFPPRCTGHSEHVMQTGPLTWGKF